MPGGKSKTLSLCEKLQLIEEHEQGKCSARELAVSYGIGKTQVYETLKNKDKIKKELSNGTSGKRKRLAYVPVYEDVNKAVWEWFSKRHSEGLPVSGTMIQAEALKVAHSLGKSSFKASNGWLDSFKTRHNIVCSREARLGDKDVIVIIEEVWKQNLPDITEGYSEEDIFVAFETGLRYKMVSMSGGCSEKLGVLLCTNIKGTLLKPLVVGKIARPKAFGLLDAATLPVHWRPSTHACITNFLVEEWLNCFNELMVAEERMVVLVLHIHSCNPTVSLSNVKVVRCPHVMDLGMILHFKALYRKSLLQTILLRLGSSVVKQESDAVKLEPSVVDLDNFSQACTSVNMLDAVNWISRAVTNIPPDLVRKSFVSSGFAPENGMVLNDDAETGLRAEIYELCQRLNLDPEDVLRFDDDFPEDPLMIKNEDVPMQDEHKLNIETYCDAIKAVNDLEKFAAYKNCPQLLGVLQDAKEALSQSCLGF